MSKDDQNFAVSVADKYRQTFNVDFCQDGSPFRRDGSQKNSFITNDKLIRCLSCQHAVYTALTFLDIDVLNFESQNAIIFLYVYKQIILRTERRRQRCSSYADLAIVNQNHEKDVNSLLEAIGRWKKRNKDQLPNGNSWICSVMWFFQQEEMFNFRTALFYNVPPIKS